SYKCITPPKKLKIKNKTVLMEESSINFENAVLAEDGEVDMFDSILLKGKNSKGIVKLRMVSNKNSRIISHSKIIAEEAGRGHIDCMGLLLSESSSIDSLPELLNKNKNAILTHEASIGKISEEELNYLRSRGLTEDEAISLIITGFLGEALPSYKGYAVPTEGHM
ncbi:SufD family Fe-S cluster assembly protein, partial [Candidatus Bathyarchaeota archaeon]|nr:SufD family Fe-S cluster assembly protein [Candidatus Bathyarchaeota archaeon]